MIPALVLSLVVAGAVEDDPRFREARRLFEDFQLEGALARFKLILLDDRLSDDERTRVLLWQGLTEAELGRFAEATKTFGDALTIDRDARLPVEASPKVIEMLEEARARVADSAAAPDDTDEDSATAIEVATREDGTVHPTGPGVLIKTTASGRMDAAVQERPPPPPRPDDDAPPPWLLLAGTTTVGVGALTLGAGGVLGALAHLDHARAVEAAGAKDASLAYEQARAEALVANVLYGIGGAVVITGIVVAAAGLLLGDSGADEEEVSSDEQALSDAAEGGDTARP